MQEEWDAIPLETSARASAAAAPTSDTPPAVSTISYDDALASLAAADMSAAVPRVVLYEAPASCFGRLLHCFGRPSLHIQNADEELQLPFLLALTPYDGCPLPPSHTPASILLNHTAVQIPRTCACSQPSTLKSPLSRAPSTALAGAAAAAAAVALCEFELMVIITGTGKVLVSRETIPPPTLEIWGCSLCCRC